MTITQTIDIPADRRITLEVPPQIPMGQVVLTFTPTASVITDQKKERDFGCLKGQIWMSDDFDEPLEDFADYM